MKKAVSIFIMDVTSSSNMKEDYKLSNYLSKWQDELMGLKKDKAIVAKHRMGDEIICLVEGYTSAMMLANYMLYSWEFEDHMPYFGISCGLINIDINEVDIDTWNHPLVKNARLANDAIKNDKSRKRLIDFMPLGKFQESEIELIQILLQWQSLGIMEQTDKQREVLKLYSAFGNQKEIAEKLEKSKSTISVHFTSGKTDLILNTADSLYNLFSFQERQSRIKENDESIELVKIKKENENFSSILREKIVKRKLLRSNENARIDFDDWPSNSRFPFTE